MKTKETITIGDSYDGFTLTHKGYSVWVSQENSPVTLLEQFFARLGYKVIVEQEY